MELDLKTLWSILQAYNTEKYVLDSRIRRNECDDLMMKATKSRLDEVNDKITKIQKMIGEMMVEE